MKPTSLSKNENEIIQKAKVYLEGRAGVFPQMLALVLNDPGIAQIRSGISEGIGLTAREADWLVETYCDEQKRYRRLCLRIADWGGLNGELLFLDSLGTDIALKIYNMNFNFLWDTETSLGLVCGEDREKAGAAIAADFLEMTESELERYRTAQADVFRSL